MLHFIVVRVHSELERQQKTISDFILKGYFEQFQLFSIFIIFCWLLAIQKQNLTWIYFTIDGG